MRSWMKTSLRPELEDLRADFGRGRMTLGLSGLILGLRAKFGSKRVDYRPGRANF